VKAYVVGGAVRDELLGLPVADRDWVVVGATPEDMARQGFRPVGKDFPVFLHPRTHEEYALARTERKSGRGYKGFTVYATPDVTLEDDLKRRDLTINAMAKDEAGRPKPFAREEHAAFQRLLDTFGDADARAAKAALITAIERGEAPERWRTPATRHARQACRIALRQLRQAGVQVAALADWERAIERSRGA